MQPSQDLLQRCRKNNRKAHNELYHLCFAYLLAICLRYTSNREDAEAILNQGFLKIITHLDKYNKEIPFKSWCSRVMVNTIIDEFRRDKKRRDHQSEIDLNDADHLSPVDWNEAAQQLDAEELERLIQELPETSRAVFNLYAIEGFSHKEIGKLLGLSDGTSKWHVSFARKTLQEKLKVITKQLLSISLMF